MGIAVHKPVFGGAPKSAPWGVIADVVKAALKMYGEDVQVCYSCAQADAPRYVGDARIPAPLPPNYGAGVFAASHVAPPPNGRVEFGATSAQNVIDAYHGTGNYAKDGPRRQLRLLANISSPLYLIVAAKRSAGITDLAQLKGRHGPLKLVVNDQIANVIFPYYGLSIESLKAAGAAFAAETSPAQRVGADVIIYTGNLANSPEFNIWYEASQRDDLVYLQLPEDLVAKLARELPNFERRDIPVGLLRGLDVPISTVARTGTVVYGRTDMPEKFAYLVAKALDEQQDLFQWTIGHYMYIRQRVARAGDVPLHPGAARYYRERGYLR
jgi:hypothetical protein